ncbi:MULTISPECIES: hypothetical protein [Anaerotruncus]|jgi:hypothetical protein|uniref:hypothetical protein n=1 Tax=Anaerotruncus TaxID=244127 RepID=UPI00208A74F5|nr:hypothetical protein [Anaerotruncus massiliensis (ex Togo et al. 2019)]GKH48476.1 hypothetical protein CE91St45_30380 [Oscillospiraceae bacterium]
MFRNPASFLKAFFGFFTAFGAVFLAIGLGVGFTAPDGIIFLLAFGLAGLTFLLVGAIGLAVLARKARLRRWLLENGRALNADYDGCGLQTSLEMNGRHPYVVHCHYTDSATRTIYNFRSEGLWFNPASLLEGRRTVRVLVHPDDYRKYYVDLGDLTNGYKVVG